VASDETHINIYLNYNKVFILPLKLIVEYACMGITILYRGRGRKNPSE